LSDDPGLSDAPVLSVRGLTTSFDGARGYVRAIEDVSFDVPRGGSLGIVGESGCGKSVTSLSVLRLLPEGARIEKGQVLFHDRDLTKVSDRELRGVRGAKIAMIFQEPMTSLNPVYTVGSQIVEAIRLHRDVSRRDARTRAVELLKTVGIPDPAARVDAYPHQLSGGMRQRVMIAMALSCEPEVLIADEPTTALDVTIQAQILDLLRRLSRERGMSVILITHDLGVVAEFVDRVVVMYAGRVVESSAVADLFAKPLHPYTRGLLRSIPTMGDRPRRLPTIDGVVPSLSALPPGCRFAGRCSMRIDRCDTEEPELREITAGHASRCHLAEQVSP
jgi:oligopeptide/dipeptide ABC transporter ATP-binding protein